jgi:8-oxo-dGTP diphosphatase
MGEKKRYEVIPRTLIFVFCGNEILLMRKAKWRNRFNALGGHIEPGEDVLSSAARELWEEAGITGQSMQIVGNILIDGVYSPGICIFLVRCDVADIKYKQGPEGELEWVAIKDLKNLSVLPDLPDLVERVSKSHRCEDFFCLHYEQDKST